MEDRTLLFQHASELAIRATLFLAQQAPGKLSPVHEIAADSGVSEAYLAKIIQRLTSGGLVRSFRGPGKGMELGRAAESISLASVIRAVEGPKETEGCVLGLGLCSEENPCALHEEWLPLRNAIQKFLDKTTLADLVQVARKHSQRRAPRLVRQRHSMLKAGGSSERKTVKKPYWMLSVLLLGSVLPARTPAQQASDFFQQNCTSCHTIGGGRLTGPDLKDVSKQKDRVWLEHFIQSPKTVMDGGDPFALQLQQDARGVVMPTVPGMTPQMAKALLDLIEAESLLPKSRFSGVSISDRPFTAYDVALGTEFFAGTRKLSQGGPPCISCHTLGTISGFGGGRLGPDLTRVYERLGGRKAAGAWLSVPGTLTMQAVFRQHPLQSEEILPLLSVFEDASRRSQPVDTGSEVNFFVAGFAGAGLSLLLMGWVWQSRLHSVRRSLVRAVQRGGE